MNKVISILLLIIGIVVGVAFLYFAFAIGVAILIGLIVFVIIYNLFVRFRRLIFKDEKTV